MDKGGRESPYQCVGDEGSSAGLECLSPLNHGGVHSLDGWQCYSGGTYYIKAGGMVSQVMYNLAQDILNWAEQLSVFLTVRYIPSKKNILANQLTCMD